MSIKGFNISGTTYKVDYPELDNLPQINGNDLVGNMNGESLGLREVAFVPYVGATNAQVETLLDSGVKIVLVNVLTDFLPQLSTTCQLVKRVSATEHHFAAVTEKGRVYAILNNNSWSRTIETYAKQSQIPEPSTTLPHDLGVAALGASMDYARSDHVHAMPAAEDVGAIPNPTEKSSGQVLTYNGYSWVARTPSDGEGMTDAVKQALLDCFEHVAWIDDQGQTYYNALYTALYPPKTVVSITAAFEQGSAVVYDSASLDSLKPMLTVTARYDDNTTDVLADSDYTLSGTLEAGTSTVTVTYNGKTDTFTVNVTAVPTLSSISAAYTQSGTVYDTDTLDSLKDDLVVTAHYSDNSTETVTNYTLSGTLAEGTSTITVSYTSGSITKTTTFNVTVEAAPSLDVPLIMLENINPQMYSDGGDTLLDGTGPSGRIYVSEETFAADTLLEITVLYGMNNANLKQTAGSWDGDTSAYKGLYAEIIGSAKTTAYTAQYTVKAGHKLLIKNYNAGTPQSITVQRVVS